MDIEFDCDKCGQHVVTDEASAGVAMQCPKCGSSITAPAKQQATSLDISFPDVDFRKLDFPDVDLSKLDFPDFDFPQVFKELSLADDSELNSFLARSQPEFEKLLKEFDAFELLSSSEVEKHHIPEPDPNLTAADVAAWMFEQVQSNGVLYQAHAAHHICRHFGNKFIYLNRNSNPAISLDVLKKFLAVSLPTVVWNRCERLWRTRRPSDPAGRRMVED